MTGYVHHIVDNNQDFPAAMLTFARGMGALIMMREDALGADVPEAFEPETTYSTWSANARRDLAAFEKMTEAQRLAWAEKSKAETIEAQLNGLAEQEKSAARLMALIVKVEAWRPPTSEHEGLKKFALQQLRDSLPDTKWAEQSLKSARERDAATIVEQRFFTLRRDIARYEEEYAEELKRTAGRNKWVADLRNSLKGKD